jgi:hypothetical protein
MNRSRPCAAAMKYQKMMVSGMQNKLAPIIWILVRILLVGDLKTLRLDEAPFACLQLSKAMSPPCSSRLFSMACTFRHCCTVSDYSFTPTTSGSPFNLSIGHCWRWRWLFGRHLLWTLHCLSDEVSPGYRGITPPPLFYGATP